MNGPGYLVAGGNARMVNVSDKPATTSKTRVEAFMRMLPATPVMIHTSGHNRGDALTAACIAGNQAARHCADFTPPRHPLPLRGSDVDSEAGPDHDRVHIQAVRDLAQSADMTQVIGA